MDFVGIAVLTLGDYVSGIFLIFSYEPTLQKRYWTMVNAFPHTWSLKTADERVRYRRYAPSLLLSLLVSNSKVAAFARSVS